MSWVSTPFEKICASQKWVQHLPPKVSSDQKKHPKTPPKPLTRLLERDIIGAATSPICFWRCNDQNSRACEGPKAPGLIYDTNVDASRNFPTIYQQKWLEGIFFCTSNSKFLFFWGIWYEFPSKATRFLSPNKILCTAEKKSIAVCDPPAISIPEAPSNEVVFISEAILV